MCVRGGGALIPRGIGDADVTVAAAASPAACCCRLSFMSSPIAWAACTCYWRRRSD